MSQPSCFPDRHNQLQVQRKVRCVLPADVYFGRDKAILRERKKIKKRTIQQRRLQHQKQAAYSITQTSQSLQCSNRYNVPVFMTTDIPQEK